MAILVNSGRAAAAAAIKALPIHMAWGSGSSAWDTEPMPEEIDAAGLVSELGRRRATQTLYCVPDVAGEIVVPQGRFSTSSTPTKYLYMRFAFNFLDAPASTIREIAVFIGTAAKSVVPPGQDYLVPSEVETPGLMLALEHIPKLERSSSVRQQFEFVVQF